MSECKLQVVKTYSGDGNSYQEFTINEQGNRHGTYKDWHDDGQLWEQSEWVNGNYHGIKYLWNEVGLIDYIEIYDNGDLLVDVVWLDKYANRLKEPILTIIKQNHAKAGDCLIEIIKVLQKRKIKFKIAKIGDSND